MAGWLLLAPAVTTSLPAQEPTPRDSARADSVVREALRYEVWENSRVIRWWQVAAVFGGVATTMVLDEPLQRYSQRHRSGTGDDVATFFRWFGEPAFYGGMSLGTLGLGFATNNADIKRAGRRFVATMILAGVVMGGSKRVVGRSRPNEGVGAFVFHPMTSLRDSAGIEARGSMPSGHTTAAFGLATTLAADIDNPVVDVLLYTFATGTAFSRIYDNRHWLSDTAMGMVLGVTSAKLVSGQWRIFSLKPPDFLLTPTGAPAVGWRIPLGHISTAP